MTLKSWWVGGASKSSVQVWSRRKAKGDVPALLLYRQPRLGCHQQSGLCFLCLQTNHQK